MAKEGFQKTDNAHKNTQDMKRKSAFFKLMNTLSLTFFYSLSILIINAALDSPRTIFLLAIDFAIALPAATLFAILKAGLALREAQLKNWRTHPLIRVVIEAFNASVLCTLTTSIALYIGHPSSTMLSSLIAAMFPVFIIALASKAVYNIGASIYYVDKSMSTSDQDRQDKSTAKAIQHLLDGIAYGGIAAAWTAMCFYPLLLTPTILTASLLAGALAVAVAFYKLYEVSNPESPQLRIKTTDLIPCNNVKLCKGLGVTHKPKVEDVIKPENNPAHTSIFSQKIAAAEEELMPGQACAKK